MLILEGAAVVDSINKELKQNTFTILRSFETRHSLVFVSRAVAKH